MSNERVIEVQKVNIGENGNIISIGDDRHSIDYSEKKK